MNRFAPCLMTALMLAACGQSADETPTSSAGAGGSSAATTANGGGSASTSASGGSGGGMESCSPGDTVSCYDGPDGTQDVGTCKAGTKTCLPSGQGYGPCEDQVVPATEKCDTEADEDCNGAGCLETEWGKLFTEGLSAFTHVKVTDAGNYLVSGYFTGTLDLGGGTTYTSLGGRDIIVAQFDQSGTVTWSKQIGTAGNDIPGDIALASDGSMYIGGGSTVGPTIGKTTLGPGPFVAKFDSNDEVVWVKQLSSGSLGRVNRLRLTATNTVLACGQANINLVGSQFGYAGQIDAFILQLDPNAGAALTRMMFGSANDDAVTDCMADDTGSIFATGFFVGTLNLDAEGIKSYGGDDIFTVRYDSLNDVVAWVKTAGSAENQQPYALRLAPKSKDVLVTGFAQGTVNFGGNDLIANAVKSNIFVVRYDENGGHKASATFGTAASIQEGYGIEVLSSGEVLVGGRTSGATNFGGGVVGTTGGQEAVLLRLTEDLAYAGGKSYGSIDHDIILDLELTPSGKAILVGQAGTGLDLGTGALKGSDTHLNALLGVVTP